jgi:hypothetical protein
MTYAEAKNFIRNYKRRLAAMRAELREAIQILIAEHWTLIQIARLGGWNDRRDIHNMISKKGKSK